MNGSGRIDIDVLDIYLPDLDILRKEGEGISIPFDINVGYGNIYFKDRAIAEYDLVYKDGITLNFKNNDLKISGKFDLYDNEISFDIKELPLLGSTFLRYDIQGLKGIFKNEHFSGELGSDKGLFYLRGENINVKIHDNRIDIDRLIYRDLSFKGHFDTKSKDIKGTATYADSKMINLIGNDKYLNVVSETGKNILTVNENGDISANFNISEMLRSDIDAHIFIAGNVKRTAQVRINNILYKTRYIETLEGVLDFSQRTAILENQWKNVNLTLSLQAPYLNLRVWDYEISHFSDIFEQEFNIPVVTAVISQMLISVEDLSIRGFVDIVNINNDFLKNFNLSMKKDKRAPYEFILKDENISLKGSYIEGDISAEAEGMYQIAKNILFKGHFNLSFKKNAVDINIGKGSKIELNDTAIPLSGKVKYHSGRFEFKDLNFIWGEFNGELDIKNDSSISSEMDLSNLNKDLPQNAKLTVGMRDNIYVILESDMLYANIVYQDNKFRVNSVKYEKDDLSLSLMGGIEKYLFSGKMVFSYGEFDLNSDIIFKLDQLEGMILLERAAFRDNIYRNGHANFRYEKGLYFDGVLPNRLIFKGYYEKDRYDIDLNFIDFSLSQVEFSNIKISGNVKIMKKDDDMMISGDIYGNALNVLRSPVVTGFFDYNTRFRYTKELLEIDNIFINGSSVRLFGSGIYRSENDLNFKFGNIMLKKADNFVETSGVIQKKGELLYLKCDSGRFHYGKPGWFTDLIWDEIYDKSSRISIGYDGDVITAKLTGSISGKRVYADYSELKIFADKYEKGKVIADISSPKRLIINVYEEKRSKRNIPLMDMNIKYEKGTLFVDDLNFYKGKGKLFVRGTVSDELALLARFEKFDLEGNMPGFKVRGNVDGEMNIGGLLSRPEIFINLSSSQGSINKLQYRNFIFRGVLDNMQLLINQCLIETRNSNIKVKNNTRFFLKNLYKRSDWYIGIEGNIDLSDLRGLFPDHIQSGKGTVLVDASISSENPLTGKIIMDFNAKFSHLFENVKTEGFTIIFGELDRIEKSGRLFIDNYPVDVQIAEDNVIRFRFTRPTRFNLPEFGLSSFFTGDIILDYSQNISIFSDDLVFEGGFLNYDPLKRSKAGEAPVELNLNARFTNVRSFNSFFNGIIKGDLSIKGYTEYELEGTVTVDEGILKFYGKDFNVENANLNIGKKIVLNVMASNKFILDREYFVNLTLSGPVENLNVKLSSVPDRNEDELKSLLFSKDYISTGLDLLITQSGITDNFTSSILFTIQRYLQISNFDVEIKSPLISKTMEEEVTFTIKGHLDAFSLETRLGFYRDHDIIRFNPEFNIGFAVNKNLQFNMLVGGRDGKFLIGPSFRF